MSAYPIINLNGDIAMTLVKQQYDVINAAKALQEAMGRATPHGRNYQCNPFSDYQTARDEWIALAQGVEAVRKTAQETMEDLLRQCDGMPGGRFAVAVDVLKVEG